MVTERIKGIYRLPDGRLGELQSVSALVYTFYIVAPRFSLQFVPVAEFKNCQYLSANWEHFLDNIFLDLPMISSSGWTYASWTKEIEHIVDSVREELSDMDVFGDGFKSIPKQQIEQTCLDMIKESEWYKDHEAQAKAIEFCDSKYEVEPDLILKFTPGERCYDWRAVRIGSFLAHTLSDVYKRLKLLDDEE